MSTDAQILILGGGLSGCLIAVDLVDRGFHVTIVEQRPQLMSGASRWNDGKIHLGYTFIGTSSLATARLMQEGSAAFIAGLERSLGETLPESWFGNGVIYIVDAKSMVDVEVLWLRAQQVARLHTESAQHQPGMQRYLGSQAPLQRLDPGQAREETRQSGIVAAWRTPERHVSSRAVGDRVGLAVRERGVDIVHGQVNKVEAGPTPWCVSLADGGIIRAPIVVNCLWESRTAIDRQVQPSTEPVSIRYKEALFGSAVASLKGLTSSTRILGPFGDIAVYNNGDAYLSWYPAGLAARSDDGIPPALPARDRTAVIEATLAGLALPRSVMQDPAADWRLEGGYVVAWGHGDIDEADSPLHERHRPGVHEVAPGFVSVDTGKYTLAPVLAQRVCERIDHMASGRPRALA
jgi:hypothetical protein